MQEHAIYSVIPPEGCAAILWRKPEMGAQAAAALKLTAASALEFGVIDGILPEPKGGAHRDPSEAAETIAGAIRQALLELGERTSDQLKADRYDRFRKLGVDVLSR